MKPAWAVIWRGTKTVAYYVEKDVWTLNPEDAQVFESWFAARIAAGIQKGVEVARCWV